MPIYMYRCNDCDHEFETRQRMADDPLTECPACGGEVRRVVGSVGVVFKGKGFYITDNRGGSTATLSTNGKDESGETASSEKTAKADAKESKSETTTQKKETAVEKSS